MVLFSCSCDPSRMKCGAGGALLEAVCSEQDYHVQVFQHVGCCSERRQMSCCKWLSGCWSSPACTAGSGDGECVISWTAVLEVTAIVNYH